MDLTNPSANGALELALTRELRAGERLLWQGQPLPRLRAMTFGIYLFAVPWTAFALFWTVMAAGGAAHLRDSEIGWLGLAFPLFGLPFIAIGLGMLAIPFAPWFTASRTLFAITSERLLKIRLTRRLTSQSVPLARVGPIERSEAADGSGSLTLTIGSHRDSDGDRVVDKLVIGDVAAVLAVEQVLREALRAS